MTASTVGWCAGLAMLAVVAAPCWPAAAGEEATVKAFAAWQGQGRTVQTGPHEATFVGLLIGPMYVETENGLLASGRIACPAIVAVGLEDGTQRGQGRCTITAQDGAQIYAEMACAGVYMVGCDGDLKLTGGTKRFAGISGGGKVTIRSDARQITAMQDNSAKEEGTGSLYVSELHYKLP
ncbi:MAG: hypothetical protein ACLQJR_30115 [Stellaceae bacterium]